VNPSIEFSGLESDQSIYHCILDRGFAAGAFLRPRVVRSGKDHVVGVEEILGPDLPHDEATEYADDDGEDGDLHAETSQIGDGRFVVHVHLLARFPDLFTPHRQLHHVGYARDLRE